MFRNGLLYLLCVAVVSVLPIRAQTAASLDTSFDPPSGQPSFSVAAVSAFALQSADSILVAGDFTVGTVPHVRVARLNANGNVDQRFSTVTADDEILALGLQSTGKMLIAGRFTSINDSPRTYLARLNPDGTLDPGFSTNGSPNFDVTALFIQADDKILIGGAFDGVNGVPRNGLARLNSDGTLDTSFDAKLDPGSFVGVIILQSNKIIVSQLLNNSTTIRRFNSDGSAETIFNSPVIDGEVFAIAGQSDGKLVVAGSFQKIGETPRNRIARLASNGTLDSSFDPAGGPDADILALAIQTDQKIIAGGNFEHFSGSARSGVARLLPNGTLDTSYNQGQGVDGAVTAIALQADGKLLIGGFISAVDGAPRDGIARLLGDIAEPPSRPVLINPLKVGNTFSASVITAPGKKYTLESTAAVDGTFSVVGTPLLGDGTPQTLTDPAASSHFAFYRVRVD
jgi:uncharacterized delta-60 repeat protein